MASCSNILRLPDLVLYNICTYISCPFDLLHFGNVCSRFHKVSMSQSLWWIIAMRWCKGLWIYIEDVPEDKNPRDWMLKVLRLYTINSTGTKKICEFENGEIWKRIESQKFRHLFGMLRLAYKREKDDNPAVLYEQWLYDLGLYCRVQPQMDFKLNDFEFSKTSILELSSLGQAVERDLRRRKQPNKDPRYYLKRVATADSDWMNRLFPVGPHGPICPLLMCPFQDAYTNEVSGLPGLAMCLSLVLEKRLQLQYRKTFLPLFKIAHIIKIICRSFIEEISLILPAMELRLGPHCLRSTILTLASDNSFNHKGFQKVFNDLNIPFKSGGIIQDLAKLLGKYEGIDFIVDEIRMRLRCSMFDEINNALGIHFGKDTAVTRINLTDSDLIGGDNSRQEMSSAVFVSNDGVLVTWHLTGRMRY